MKVLALVSAIFTFGNALSLGQNFMGQQAVGGLGIMERQGDNMIKRDKPMAFSGMPIGMKQINFEEMMKNQRGQKTQQVDEMGICSGPCSQDRNRIKQAMAYDMTEQMQQVQMQQLMNKMNLIIQQAGNTLSLEQEKAIVSQVAKQITQQMHQEELSQMQQSVKQIQQQYQNMMTTRSMIQRMAQQQAVQEIQKDMVNQQELMSRELDNPMSKVQRCLEVTIEAQMVLQNIQNQLLIQNPTTADDIPSRVNIFQDEMQQVLKQINMEQTKAVMATHENKVQQIQMILQFLSKQIQKLQMQQDMCQEKKMPLQVMQQLQTLQQNMEQQQQQLMVELMAHQTGVYQLQQTLLSQLTQLQQQMSSQPTVEYFTQRNNPMMMMMSMTMPEMMQA